MLRDFIVFFGWFFSLALAALCVNAAPTGIPIDAPGPYLTENAADLLGFGSNEVITLTSIESQYRERVLALQAQIERQPSEISPNTQIWMMARLLSASKRLATHLLAQPNFEPPLSLVSFVNGPSFLHPTLFDESPNLLKRDGIETEPFPSLGPFTGLPADCDTLVWILERDPTASSEGTWDPMTRFVVWIVRRHSFPIVEGLLLDFAFLDSGLTPMLRNRHAFIWDQQGVLAGPIDRIDYQGLQNGTYRPYSPEPLVFEPLPGARQGTYLALPSLQTVAEPHVWATVHSGLGEPLETAAFRLRPVDTLFRTVPSSEPGAMSLQAELRSLSVPSSPNNMIVGGPRRQDFPFDEVVEDEGERREIVYDFFISKFAPELETPEMATGLQVSMAWLEVLSRPELEWLRVSGLHNPDVAITLSVSTSPEFAGQDIRGKVAITEVHELSGLITVTLMMDRIMKDYLPSAGKNRTNPFSVARLFFALVRELTDSVFPIWQARLLTTPLSTNDVKDLAGHELGAVTLHSNTVVDRLLALAHERGLADVAEFELLAKQHRAIAHPSYRWANAGFTANFCAHMMTSGSIN